MFRMTTGEIAQLTGGELQGPGDAEISGVGSLESAGEEDVAFVAKENLLEAAAKCRAGALLTAWPAKGFGGAQILCADPERAMSLVLDRVHRALFPRPTGISPSACIDPTARLGEGASVGHCAVIEEGAVIGEDAVIYPLAYVGRHVRIGARTAVHPHATICDRVRIGADCVVRPNCVIGGDGFGYIQRDGCSLKLQQVGTVHIGDNTEIHGLTSVDRGMLVDTVLGEGVKVDKHCHIAHNCRIGDRCVMAGASHMAGSVTVGSGAMLAAGVDILDHIEIGEGAMVAAGAGVMRDVPPGECVLGAPARPIGEQKRIYAVQGRLPQMHKDIVELKKQVEALKKRLNEGG